MDLTIASVPNFKGIENIVTITQSFGQIVRKWLPFVISFWYNRLKVLNYFIELIHEKSAISVKQATIGTVFTKKYFPSHKMCL